MTETLSTSKEIPKTRLALEEKYKNEPKEPHAKRLDPDNIKDMVSQLPEPVGYRLLVLPFTPKEKTKGGILFSQEQLDKARIATTCGYVLKMGDLAYKEKEMKQAILQALEDRYNAQISEADATIKIYLENSVGIGEHPQHIDEVDKLIEKIANAQEKLKELQHYKL